MKEARRQQLKKMGRFEIAPAAVQRELHSVNNTANNNTETPQFHLSASESDIVLLRQWNSQALNPKCAC